MHTEKRSRLQKHSYREFVLPQKVNDFGLLRKGVV